MFNKTTIKMWALIFGGATNSLGVFIVVPLISLYALDYFHLSAVQIGLISAIWPATVFCLSFFCGMLAERVGYLYAIRLGLVLNSLAFLLMTLSRNVVEFGFTLFLFGLGKSLFDSSIRAAMTCLAETSKLEKFFRLRYLINNIGCMLGPLIGIVAYKRIYGGTFALSALVFSAFLICTFIYLQNRDFKIASYNRKNTFFQNFKVLKDLNLLYWVVSGTGILISYGAYEALMPVVVSQTSQHKPAFGILVSLNAVVAILFQFLYLKLFKGISIQKSINYGFALLVLGFILFTLNWHPYSMTLIATIVFSVGESILFPCFEVVMGQIAPLEQKAVYFGAGELRQIGFFIGPIVGGFLFEFGGTAALFSACALSIAIAALCFKKISLYSSRVSPIPISNESIFPAHGSDGEVSDSVQENQLPC